MDILGKFNFRPATKDSIAIASLSALLSCHQQSAAATDRDAAQSNAAAAPDEATDAEAASRAKRAKIAPQGAAEQQTEAETTALQPAEAIAGSEGIQAPQKPFCIPEESQAAQATNGTAADSDVHQSSTVGQDAGSRQAEASTSGRQDVQQPLPETAQRACSLGFTGCVLAVPGVQPLALLQKVLPLLAPSAAFAVFSNWLQPLAECMLALQV